MITIGGRYEPIIKLPKFDPSPIRRYGIPYFADSKSNPGCVGTVAHEDFWNEQIDRCVNGYITGGIHIPGRHYYYLNFNKILTLKRGYHLPEYVDQDYEFFRLFDFCAKEGEFKNDPTAGGKGIITLKRRRCGVSHKMSQGVFGYGVRFNSGGWKAGIVAGKEDKAAAFFDKFKFNEGTLPPELQLKAFKGDDYWIASYDRRTVHENFVRDGSFNTIFCRTAQSDENVFKGEILNVCDFEEGGEFKKLMKCFSSTKACFMAGHEMVGVPVVQGTGGDIKDSSKDFKDLLEEADYYRLIPIDILGPRMQTKHFIGSVNVEKNIEEDCPYLLAKYPNLEYEQLLGCEDLQRSEEVIIETRAQLKKLKNKKAYYEYLQDNPLSRKDAFLNLNANPFDPDILAECLHNLSNDMPKYRKVKLEWATDKDGVREVPLKVNVIHAKEEDEEHDCCLMLMDAKWGPRPNHKNLDVAGCDSYDMNQSLTSKSLGGFLILRRTDPETGETIRKPIFIIRQRPKRKEVFYDNCLKASVLYNLRGNMLIDAANSLIVTHFITNGGKQFLAPKPKAFESPDSEQSHDFGAKMNTHNRPKVLAMTETWVNDYAPQCDFPHVILELGEYDVEKGEQGDSDQDLADALMLALYRDVDMKKAPKNEDSKEKKDSGDLTMWQTIGGRMVPVNEGESAGGFKWEPGFGPDSSGFRR